MGVEVKPPGGKPFTEITFEGAECVLKGKKFPVEGTAIGTGSRGGTETVSSSGATLLFTNSMTKEALKLAGNVAEFSSTITVKMKEKAGEETNPIVLTTTEP